MMYLAPAVHAHAQALVPDARQQDINEWTAASGMRLVDALVFCIDVGKDLAQAVVDAETGRVLCIFGASPSSRPEVGIAWLVATNEAYAKVHRIHRLLGEGLGKLHERYPELHAWAYSRNTVHHVWMRRFGFDFSGDRVDMGLGFTFLKFVRTLPRCQPPTSR